MREQLQSNLRTDLERLAISEEAIIEILNYFDVKGVEEIGEVKYLDQYCHSAILTKKLGTPTDTLLIDGVAFYIFKQTHTEEIYYEEYMAAITENKQNPVEYTYEHYIAFKGYSEAFKEVPNTILKKFDLKAYKEDMSLQKVRLVEQSSKFDKAIQILQPENFNVIAPV